MVSNEKFVKEFMQAYREGKSSAELSRKLGQSKNYVTMKAAYLRNKGVRLPKLAYSYPKFDAEALNRLIEE